jgi:kinesin family protein C1
LTVACAQTGSGKTYTMLGDAARPGLIPRALELLFQRVQYMDKDGWKSNVSLEVLEIYNETVKDLLCTECMSRLSWLSCQCLRHCSRPCRCC